MDKLLPDVSPFGTLKGLYIAFGYLTSLISRFKKGGVKAATSLMLMMAITLGNPIPTSPMSSIINQIQPLQPLKESRSGSEEVFGFAPYWTFNKLNNVDFDILTTMAYFDVPVLSDGSLDRSSPGYTTFKSSQATSLFKKAHQEGTRVVLTITQMNNGPIRILLDNPEAQDRAISEVTQEVQNRGIDGINIDLEYGGDPGQYYRDRFTDFVDRMTKRMHEVNPNSKVTVSVYAGSVRDPKIYDIKRLAQVSDGIFMMAYDFANASSDAAMPTAPLYGHKDGTYWYDVSTAVEDFLKVMPANKLILGVPWYGYNYPVYQPAIKAPTAWGSGISQPYGIAQENITPELSGYREGWDDKGQVGWKAYLKWGGWRMIFLEDAKSLGLKYDFAKSKDLAGVGIWALGFDEGKSELWQVLKEKFGTALKDDSVLSRAITNTEEVYD